MKRKIITMKSYNKKILKSELCQIYNLMMFLEVLEKQGQSKCKSSRQEGLIKSRTETQGLETKTLTHKISQGLDSLKTSTKINETILKLTKE